MIYWDPNLACCLVIASQNNTWRPSIWTQVFFDTDAGIIGKHSAMAKRKKNKTHLKGAKARETHSDGLPKSFIIKHGQVGSSITQLVRDMRKVMEPNTASRLKVGDHSTN